MATLLSNIGILHASQPQLSSRLDGCAPGKTLYFGHGVHYQGIISNIVLQLSLSIYNAKWIA